MSCWTKTSMAERPLASRACAIRQAPNL